MTLTFHARFGWKIELQTAIIYGLLSGLSINTLRQNVIQPIITPEIG